MKHHLLLILLLTLAVGTASAQDAPTLGSVVDTQFITPFTVEQSTELILDFYPSTNFVEPQFDVDSYIITLITTNVDGTPVETDARLYVPRSDTPAALPIYVVGPGTTGLADRCSALLEQPDVADWGQFERYLQTFASQGYITIMADYVGFKDPDVLQPYYVSDMQGQVALDAARAVFEVYDRRLIDTANGQPFDAVFVGGYSQGGQTVFAARDIQQDYAPEVPLAGVIGIGSVTDQINHMITRPEFAGFRWVAWEQFYGPEQVDYSVIFNDLFLPTIFNSSTTLCLREAFALYSDNPRDVYREAFADALLAGTLESDFPQIYDLLVANSPGFTASDVPALIVQGTEDATIGPEAMAEFVTRYCAIEGNVLTYNEYISTTHFNSREVSYLDTLNWMANILQGNEVPNSCGDFVGQ